MSDDTTTREAGAWTCAVCDEVNPATKMYCGRCGTLGMRATPRPDAASASITEAKPIAALRDLAHRLRGIRYADYSGELTRIADALAAAPRDAGREENERLGSLPVIEHPGIPRGSFYVHPDTLRPSAEKLRETASLLDAARRGATG